MTAPFGDAPARRVAGRDGTPIAVFESAPPGARSAAGRPVERGRPPILLVHGTSADHRTWRVVAPALAPGRLLAALDRRGRGASGDAADWAIERELEDLVAVAETLAQDAGGPIDVVGHSLGGRIALAAAPATGAIRRIVAYESAPAPRGDDRSEALLAALRVDLQAGALDGLLARFMTEAVGMPPDELEAFRANPIWAARAAAGKTIVRELDAVLHASAIGADALARVQIPVLQLAGSASAWWFREGAARLDRQLAHGRLIDIDGARHAAHHTHPEAFVAEVERFLDG